MGAETAPGSAGAPVDSPPWNEATPATGAQDELRNAGARELEGRRAAEAVAHDGDALGIDALLGAQALETREQAGPERLDVAVPATGLGGGALGSGADALSVDVAGQRDVAEAGEHLRPHLDVVDDAEPVVQHQDAGSRLRRLGRVRRVRGGAARPGEEPLEIGGSVAVHDVARFDASRVGHGGEQSLEVGGEVLGRVGVGHAVTVLRGQPTSRVTA
jgi:hypothetical protein